MHTPTMISVQGLTKRFGSVVAVDNLTLEIKQQEIYGFLGPNGAGKTTSINMLCGYLKPDKGTIRFSDSLAQSPSPRDHIGICPQELVLWNELTCQEQLVYIARCYDVPKAQVQTRAQMLLDAMGLTPKTHTLAKNLSGGMKRRLNLIMGLMHDPAILILDEPEAGLDPQSRVLVRDYIARLCKEEGKTVVLTSHNMDEVERLADRVAIIDKGSKLVEDTPESLKNHVGSGDVLEIKIGTEQVEESQLKMQLADLAEQFQFVKPILSIQGYHLVDTLPAIVNRLREHSYPIGSVQLRRNTLEDVFIALTGRQLRV
jgi:ABC-2 type transport system ATP-binding protein